MPVQPSCGGATCPRLECGNGGEARPHIEIREGLGMGSWREGVHYRITQWTETTRNKPRVEGKHLTALGGAMCHLFYSSLTA